MRNSILRRFKRSIFKFLSNTFVGFDKSEKPVINHLPLAVVSLIVNDEGKVLATSRGDDLTKWGIPGGKVHAGEPLNVANARELLEETGLDALEQTPVFDDVCDGSQPFFTTAFIVDVDYAQDILPSEEGAVAWLDAKLLIDPKHSPFHEYNRKLFAHLGWVL